MLITFRCLSTSNLRDCRPFRPHWMSVMDSLPLSVQLRNARRALRLTQTELARKTGCNQSAISMMEGGQTGVLGRASLEAIANILGVELPPEDSPPPVAVASSLPVADVPLRICPNTDCPGNLPYRAGPDILLMPTAHRTTGDRCPLCGEVLVSSCPDCGAPLRAGAACCTSCGAPLVPPPAVTSANIADWIAERQRQSTLIRGWSI